MSDQATGEQLASWTVPPEVKEIRLDTFTRRCLPHLSRRAVQIIINDNSLRVNGRVVKKGQKLSGGDRLDFNGSDEWLQAKPIPNAALAVPVVYEDASLLAVDKPAKMPAHGFSARDTMTLTNFIVARYPGLEGVGENRWQPGLVHRLDGETSGLMLVAKTQAAFDNLRDQLRRRAVRKFYLALVWGQTEPVGSLTYAIAHDRRDKRAMRAFATRAEGVNTQRTWEAVTWFRTLAWTKGLSLLELEMQTGVMHQLRVHLATGGHPIVGDLLYGAQYSERFGLRRHFLHATRLEFYHPDDGRRVCLDAPLPGELLDVLGRLGIVI